jgi:hypothetical protein
VLSLLVLDEIVKVLLGGNELFFLLILPGSPKL